MRSKQHLQLTLGLLCSVLFLWLAFKDIEFAQVKAEFSKLSLSSIAVLIGVYLLGFLLRGFRCHMLLPSLNLRDSLKVVFIGYAVNNVLPARMGELARAHATAKQGRLKYGTALASVFVERVFDGAAIVLCLLVSSFWFDLPEWAGLLRATAALLFFPALAVLLTLPFIYRRLRLSEKKLPLKGPLESFIEGLAFASRSLAACSAVFLPSLAVWLVESLMFYVGFEAFNLNTGYIGSVFSMSVVNLATLLPSSPGNVGVFQYALLKSLQVFGVEQVAAATLGIILHLCQIIPVTIIGLFFTLQHGRSLFAPETSDAD